MTNAAATIDYEYDGMHRRIVKEVGSDKYDYYYNLNDQVVEVRLDGQSKPIERYTWHPYYIDALATRFYDDYTNGSGQTQYSLHDANFNVSGLCDANGAVIERYDYKPYGELDVLNASYASIGTSTVANP